MDNKQGKAETHHTFLELHTCIKIWEVEKDKIHEEESDGFTAATKHLEKTRQGLQKEFNELLTNISGPVPNNDFEHSRTMKMISELNALAIKSGKYQIALERSLDLFRKSDRDQPGRKRFFEDMKKHMQGFSSSSIQDLKKYQGMKIGQEQSLVQCLKVKDDKEPKELKKLDKINIFAINLGIEVSAHLVRVLAMMRSEGVADMDEKFETLQSLFQFLEAALDYSGDGAESVAYKRIITILAKADKEMEMVLLSKSLKAKISTDWYASIPEVEIDQLLEKFAEVISTMEFILSFPLLSDAPILLMTRLTWLQNELNLLQKKLTEINSVVEQMYIIFTIDHKLKDTTVVRDFESKMVQPVKEVWFDLN